MSIKRDLINRMVKFWVRNMIDKLFYKLEFDSWFLHNFCESLFFISRRWLSSFFRYRCSCVKEWLQCWQLQSYRRSDNRALVFDQYSKWMTFRIIPIVSRYKFNLGYSSLAGKKGILFDQIQISSCSFSLHLDNYWTLCMWYFKFVIDWLHICFINDLN